MEIGIVRSRNQKMNDFFFQKLNQFLLEIAIWSRSPPHVYKKIFLQLSLISSSFLWLKSSFCYATDDFPLYQICHFKYLDPIYSLAYCTCISFTVSLVPLRERVQNLKNFLHECIPCKTWPFSSSPTWKSDSIIKGPKIKKISFKKSNTISTRNCYFKPTPLRECKRKVFACK